MAVQLIIIVMLTRYVVAAFKFSDPLFCFLWLIGWLVGCFVCVCL